MRHARFTAALLALAVVAVTAAPALAWYDPKHGRFLTRDPAGTGDIVIHDQQGGPRIVVAPGVVSPFRIGSIPVRAPANNFIPRDPLPGTGPYVDGMNLYEYGQSGPIGVVDPSGMVVVGLDGWDRIPGMSGRADVDKIGNNILRQVNAWRLSHKMLPDKHVPLRGSAGAGEGPIGAEVRAYRDRRKGPRPDCYEGFVLLGYSDGATSMYLYLNNPAIVADTMARPHHHVILSYAGFIDMVRAADRIIPAELTKTKPYESRSADLAFENLILHGDAFYENADSLIARILPLGASTWKGYTTIGKGLGGILITPSDHLAIIHQSSLQNELTKKAVESYVEHMLMQMQGIKLTDPE